jgi:hypothetical protein
MKNKKARVIAFYLPQFHPIAENDKWWGKGFTEWTNVGKAKPMFRGHYQPRVPADLGYYDLRMPEVREVQAEMAREAGIEGFMYWHYWFGNGKRLMADIFDTVLKSGKPDFPFCLGWANHSWTTHSWNPIAQNKKDVIIVEQLYPGTEDYINHFNTILPAFKDKRYITVEDKPIFMFYAPLDFPDIKIFMDLWNELAVKNGLKGIHFVGLTGGWEKNNQEVLNLGVDAIAPNNLWSAESKVKGKFNKMFAHKVRQLLPIIWLNKYKYKDIIKFLFNDIDKLENAYPSIIPQWDRSPRSGRRAVIYTGSTPYLFKSHVREAISIVSNKPDDKKIIFLRSWNEWAEGNYVEPDLKFGHGYLEALKNSLY